MLRVITVNFLVSIPFILAQLPGPCPNLPVIHQDPYRSAGVWHVYKLSLNVYDPAIKCSRINRSLPYNGSNYTVIMESVSTITNKITTIVAEGNVNSPTLRHHVPILGEVDVDNYSLGIDYDKYRVMWQCNNHGNTHTEATWILTRERVQYPDLKRFIDQSFRNWRLQKPVFSTPDTNCPF